MNKIVEVKQEVKQNMYNLGLKRTELLNQMKELQNEVKIIDASFEGIVQTTLLFSNIIHRGKVNITQDYNLELIEDNNTKED